MIPRGLGCLPDAPDAKGTHGFLDVCGAKISWVESHGIPVYGVDVQPSVDLSHLCAPVTDQNPREACIGHGIANAICQAGRRTNPQFERPSQLLIWDMARGICGTRGQDIGTTPSAAFQGLEQCGFASESAVPWDPSRYADRLYADEYQSAIAQIGLRTHRVLVDVKAAIMAALSAERGCIVCIDVDQSFLDLTPFPSGACFDGMTEPRLGGHCLSVCGYSSYGIRVINSWGINWGWDGYCWISWDYITSEHCRSVWIVDAAPEYWREA